MLQTIRTLYLKYTNIHIRENLIEKSVTLFLCSVKRKQIWHWFSLYTCKCHRIVESLFHFFGYASINMLKIFLIKRTSLFKRVNCFPSLFCIHKVWLKKNPRTPALVKLFNFCRVLIILKYMGWVVSRV